MDCALCTANILVVVEGLGLVVIVSCSKPVYSIQC